MSSFINFKEEAKEDEQFISIKKLLKEKNLDPHKSKDLKYLLSLTLRPMIKKFNFEYLLIFLLKYLNPKNKSIFYEFLFQSCELGKLNNVKILLDNGFSVNCQNDLGETPLHIAIAKNDLELINLLIKYEPNTNLSTDKDEFTALSYAEIRGNQNIIKIINDLNEKNKKKLIKSEIINYINKDLSKINNIGINDISSFVGKNNDFEEIQNYNGEKMSIMANEDSINNINNNNINKNLNNNCNNVLENVNNKKQTISQTILNESDLCEDISPKNTIKINNFSNNINNINSNLIIKDEKIKKMFTEEFTSDIRLSKQFSTEFKYFTSPLRKKDELLNYYNNRSINPSCVQSLTTSHTINKDHYDSPLINNKASKSINKKIELSNFMSEIGLPYSYANNLIDNGFDDLEVLISQTKKNIALTEQNLKDIGINLPGDRAKIMIHLEELAGKFPFKLEKDIIYFNKNEENNMSLYNFLTSINLEEYIETFIHNGYNNAELLYIQMVSKNPITEDILKNDFGLNKIGHIKRIMLNLVSCSENYIKKLKNKNIESRNSKSIVFEGNPFLNSCDACFIF